MIDLLITAWPREAARLDYFKHTLQILREKLTPSELSVTVAAETQAVPPALKREFEKYCTQHGYKIVYNHKKACLGRNLNNAIKTLKQEFVFYVQDDWELDRELDLNQGVEVLRAYPNVPYIRYFWNPGHLPKGSAVAACPEFDGFEFLPAAFPFSYSHNPYLARRSFFSEVGAFSEQANVHNEQEMNKRVQKRKLPILVPSKSYFTHSGKVSVLADRHRMRMRRKLSTWRKDELAAYDADHRVSQPLLTELAKLLYDYLPERILELGPGLTTLLFRKYMNLQAWHSEVKFVSIDQEGRYAGEHLENLASLSYQLCDAIGVPHHWIVPQLANGFYNLDRLYEFDGPWGPHTQYDFILIDGPSGGKARNCDGMMTMLQSHATQDAIIVVDDTHRAGEQALLKRIVTARPGAKITKIEDSAFKRQSTVVVPAGRGVKKLLTS